MSRARCLDFELREEEGVEVVDPSLAGFLQRRKEEKREVRFELRREAKGGGREGGRRDEQSVLLLQIGFTLGLDRGEFDTEGDVE